MRPALDQSKALRRAARTAWVSAMVTSALFFALAMQAAGEGNPLFVFGAAGLMALAMMALTTRAVARLPERYRLEEVHVRVPDADRAVAALTRHMGRWWAISVVDARKWRSAYDESDGAPAPLRLPFEVGQHGDELVLRGSAMHVAVARRLLGRGPAPRGHGRGGEAEGAPGPGRGTGDADEALKAESRLSRS